MYGQTQLQADLVAASEAAGRPVYYDTSDAALHDLDSDHPYVTFTDSRGNPQRIDAAAVVGCDGSFGPSRAAMPGGQRETWERIYPFSWLGILADVAPSTDELIYAWHPDGFALHSMRSATVSRLYLQVPNGTDVHDWSDDRIWDGAGDPARVRAERVDADPGAGHREERAADAVVRPVADAARTAVPGRGRGAHRPADGGEGA